MAAAEAWPAVVWTQIWQIAAVVCAVAVAVRLAARHRPYLSHALWLVVLLKCITPPVFCSPAGVFCWLRPSAADSPAAVSCLSRPADDADNRPARQVLSARVRTERQSLADMLADARRTRDHAADARPMLAPVEIEPAASPSMTRLALRVLGAVWAGGTLVIFVGTSVWLVVGLRRLRRDGCRVDPALQRLTTSLARRLGLRRRVRLLVTAGRVGPAVFGLIRPTVLLPEAIVHGRPVDEIEPILAHELIHIRRGDLWVGLLQTVAQAVWWFHPGVWLTGRWIYRDAERCCDEAVVAELRCPPSRYARSLLEVLARKRDLVPLPSLPGVRPVELTSKRMERIMRLGQGCRGRSPWWCWAVMLLAAVAVLPGAARMVAAESEQDAKERRIAARNRAPLPQPVTEWGAAPPVATGSDQVQIEMRFISGPPASIEKQVGGDWTLADAVVPKDEEPPLDSSRGPSALLGWDQNARPLPNGMRAQSYVEGRLPATFKVLNERESVEMRDYAQRHPRINILQAPKITMSSGQTYYMADAARSPFVVGVKSIHGDFATALQPQIRLCFEGVRVCGKAVLQEGGRVRLECRVVVSEIADVKTKSFSDPSGPNLARMNYTIQMPEVARQEVEAAVEMPLGQTLAIAGFSRKGPDGPVSIMVMVTPTKAAPAKSAAEKPAVADACHVVKPITEEDRRALEEFYREKGYSSVRVAPPAKPRRAGDSERKCYEMVYDVGDLVLPIPNPVNVPSPQAVADRGASTRDVGGRAARIPDVADSSSARPVAYENVLPPRNMGADFQPLVELIQSTVRPDTWDDMGGLGTIKPYENNLTLAINQTKEVHEEIVDLLAQLRRMHDVQVMLDVRRIDMAGNTFDKLGIELDAKHGQTTLGPREARLFWALANSAGQGRVLQCPRATCFNGQQAWFGLGEKSTNHGESILTVQGTVNSGNRAEVRLATGFLGRIASSPHLRGDTFPPTTLLDGQTLLVDVTGLTPAKPLLDGEVGIPIKPDSNIFKSVKPDTSAQRVFLSITPKVVVAVEEEERITPKPQPKAADVRIGQPKSADAPADSRKPARAYETEADLGMVKPCVIIQEEEEERLGRGVEP